MLGPPSVVVGGNKPVVLPLSSIYSPPFAFTSVTALKSKKEYTATSCSRPGHPKKEKHNFVSCECSSVSFLIFLKIGSKEIQLPPFPSVGRYCCFCRTLWRHPIVWYAHPSYFDTWSHTQNNVLFSNHSHFSAEYLKSIPGQVISSWTQRVAKRLLRDMKDKMSKSKKSHESA